MRVTITNIVASAKRKGWSKWVSRVDRGKRNGYAFDGAFLHDGEHDLPDGAIVIQKNPEGPVHNAWFSGVAFRVTAGAPNGLEPMHTQTFDWYKEFPSFRDLVAKAVETSPCGATTVDSSEANAHKTEAPAAKATRSSSVIRVTVQEGRVVAVSGIPDGCLVEVFDYDVAAYPAEKVSKDQDGDECVRSGYANIGCAGRNP